MRIARSAFASVIARMAAALALATGLSMGLAALAPPARAMPVTVDAETGLNARAIDFRFYWRGKEAHSVGTPRHGGPSFDPIWRITVEEDSYISVEAMDGFVPRDAFALVFDGEVIPWESVSHDSGHFVGQISSLFLSAGAHEFRINILPESLPGGAGWLNFSAARRAAGKALATPIPGALALFAAGFAGLAFARRRALSARR